MEGGSEDFLHAYVMKMAHDAFFFATNSADQQLTQVMEQLSRVSNTSRNYILLRCDWIQRQLFFITGFWIEHCVTYLLRLCRQRWIHGIGYKLYNIAPLTMMQIPIM